MIAQFPSLDLQEAKEQFMYFQLSDPNGYRDFIPVHKKESSPIYLKGPLTLIVETLLTLSGALPIVAEHRNIIVPLQAVTPTVMALKRFPKMPDTPGGPCWHHH